MANFKKNYIFLCWTISAVGGSTLYVRSKMQYLKLNKWGVYIFPSVHNGALTDDLEEYSNENYSFLKNPPYYYRKKTLTKLLNKIEKNIDFSKHTIIETHTLTLALWGELLAQKHNCKHIVYLLDEVFPKYNKYEYEFLSFKHGRKELAGIVKQSLSKLFKNYKEIMPKESYYLGAHMINPIQYTNKKYDKLIIKADLHIASIGRLDKKYIDNATTSIIAYAKKHPSNQFQYFIFGHSYNENVNNRFINYKNLASKNLNITFMGSLYPMPQQLLEQLDLIIGSSGSAWHPYARNMITLDLNPEGKPLGIIGYDTEHSLFGKTSDKSISDYINLIKDNNIIIKHCNYPEINIVHLFDDHKSFIDSSSSTKEYYNIFKCARSLKNQFLKCLFITIGNNNFLKLTETKNKLRKLK